MKKIIVIIFISLILMCIFGMFLNKIVCFNNYHRGVYPVNPYCTKCHGRDGDVKHNCTNPNGKDKYCSVCGKIVVNK